MIVDIVKNDEIIVEKDINLTIRIDVLTNERNEALKVREELTRLVESQDEEFNRRIRKVFMEMERKDKKCQALEEELVRKESALKIFKEREVLLEVTRNLMSQSNLRMDVRVEAGSTTSQNIRHQVELSSGRRVATSSCEKGINRSYKCDFILREGTHRSPWHSSQDKIFLENIWPC
ncbi:hypothetical protein LWI28_022355 [Acer negundo]|uniref:Uncharacterized protein n=1 Tax=Acer negundo TaxID=4023 RepID=A0AAD5NG74_ACENE|nr:hypothetical protein LWI28_022355 [Acer negundo]